MTRAIFKIIFYTTLFKCFFKFFQNSSKTALKILIKKMCVNRDLQSEGVVAISLRVHLLSIGILAQPYNLNEIAVGFLAKLEGAAILTISHYAIPINLQGCIQPGRNLEGFICQESRYQKMNKPLHIQLILWEPML